MGFIPVMLLNIQKTIKVWFWKDICKRLNLASDFGYVNDENEWEDDIPWLWLVK